jgi:predicted ATP-dependent endonuclease of OLD family
LLLAQRLGGLLLLIEEPELYLRPQAQGYLYRLMREFSLAGNQIIYSTHSRAFLNVARLDELVFVERLPRTGRHALQPEPVTPDEDFRVMTEFDAARSELFLARAAVLVEGLTEKLVLPFVFSALGHDVDREAIRTAINPSMPGKSSPSAPPPRCPVSSCAWPSSRCHSCVRMPGPGR